MADTLKNAGQQAQSGVQSATGSGTQSWSQMSEEQKKQTFDALPEEKKHNKTYTEWIKEGYQHQKENWMPWIEDFYLRWFTNDNKASYATKDTLGKTKVTGVDQVDNLQDGANNLVAGQVGQGGLLQPVGDAFSKEGVNRAERGGKDDKGSYGGGAASSVTDPVVNNAKAAGQSVSSGAQGAGSYVTGLFGAGKKEGEATQKE
ncbi:hypothetical protein Slin15195_G003970 [Septoria linicola]|uniref:Uncharacterized protein n=1 Tax=Septoria linicola TaxID=215465 RepID=A0A9Q9AHN6_9PEZI|nr:hypothetical protein Slin14017_G004000 [Septoria linicola]USW47078.1 hypothetical protein Slin15195_G003970 [Septoria linicola]